MNVRDRGGVSRPDGREARQGCGALGTHPTAPPLRPTVAAAYQDAGYRGKAAAFRRPADSAAVVAPGAALGLGFARRSEDAGHPRKAAALSEPIRQRRRGRLASLPQICPWPGSRPESGRTPGVSRRLPALGTHPTAPPLGSAVARGADRKGTGSNDRKRWRGRGWLVFTRRSRANDPREPVVCVADQGRGVCRSRIRQAGGSGLRGGGPVGTAPPLAQVPGTASG